jgi:DNA-directed RNA polymerase specialized sigma24 family protein
VTGDLASAEDAVQEAIVRAWERSDRGQEILALDQNDQENSHAEHR